VRETRRRRNRDSNSRSLSAECRLILGEERGPELDQGGLERRLPLSTGDQRIESRLLRKRVGCSFELRTLEIRRRGNSVSSIADAGDDHRRCLLSSSYSLIVGNGLVPDRPEGVRRSFPMVRSRVKEMREKFGSRDHPGPRPREI